MSLGKLNIDSITSGYRTIHSGGQYNKYFKTPEHDDRIVIQDGNVNDTVELMKKVVWKYLSDTKKIAQKLKESSLQRTCENIWKFLYHNIQYKLDQEGLEQLRRPARSWADRKSGIDCDCFAIFTSSILTNLEIPHYFRITKYDGSDHFQHVYVVVPQGNDMIKIDPVLSTFNYEKPFSSKHDIPMNLNGIDVAVLSGIPHTNDPFYDQIYNYLLETRTLAIENPSLYEQEFISALDFAIKYWNTSQRQEALEVIAQKLNGGPLGGIGGIQEFFKNLQKVGNGAKNAVKAVVKYNPISVLARTGFILALKLNFRGMRKKLRWGYASRSQAREAGVKDDVHQRTQLALERVKVIWTKKLFGKEETLKHILLNGREESIGQLGAEPVTTAAAITAATPVIVAVIKILKDAGLMSKTEDASEYSIKAELTAQSNQDYSQSYTSSLRPGGPMPNDGGSFLKNNSTLLLAGAGVVVIGSYFLLKKKPVNSPLSGPSCLSGTCRKKAPSKRTSMHKRSPLKRAITKVSLS